MRTEADAAIVVSALRARAHFGKLLRRVEEERRSLVIEKRGTPKAVLQAASRFRKNLPRSAHPNLAQLEITVRRSLLPAEAYNMVPGRDPQSGQAPAPGLPAGERGSDGPYVKI